MLQKIRKSFIGAFTESVLVDIINYYCPQTKFGAKVMFLHLSVSHSGHRGWSVCLRVQGVCLPLGSWEGGVCLWIWGCVHTPLDTTPLDTTHPWTHTTPLDRHPWTDTPGHPQTHPLDTPPPLTSVRYASYWNAFLLINRII